MSEPGDTRRDLRYIRYLYHTAKRPMDAIRNWAKQRERIHRFGSAAKWARQMQRAANTRKSALKWKKIHNDFLAKVEWLETHKDPGPVPNLMGFDGKQVPGWIGVILNDARRSGVWDGYVISGYRSPSYSTSLCYAICGAPSCSGRCAGAASNHACPPSGTGVPHEGAVDVSDPAGLQSYCRAHGLPLHGNGEMLSLDHPHFSYSGR